MNLSVSHGVAGRFLRRMLQLLAFGASFFTPTDCKSQLPDHTLPFTRDSIKSARVPRSYTLGQRFGRSAFELGLAETLVWGFDRYVKKADYAYINLQTMASHLTPKSWAWDKDPFPTNQIGHPFHGSIFYNSFRSNGFNFWQSAPAAFVGSYLWETFGENELPATNDFINTGLAGVMLGEVTHRLAEKIHNSHRRGFVKKAGEVFAFLINPMDGFNRLADGQWGKTPFYARKGELPAINMDFEVGLRKFTVNTTNPFEQGHFGAFGRIKLIYGTPGKDYKTPFSNFSLVTEFGEDDSSGLNIVSVQGSITGWKTELANTTHLTTITANYDYIRNEAFFYSGESVKLNLLSEFDLPKHSALNTYLGIGPVLLVAIPDAYREFSDRNYDYGSGAAFNAGALLNLNNRLFYNIRYTGSWTRTLNGNRSNYYLSTFINELSLRVGGRLHVSAESGYFKLRGFYKNFPDVFRSYPYLRLSVRYGITI
jgi:hypothetical protein